MWGAWLAVRGGVGIWRWYQAGRAKDKAAHEATGIDNGPWTPEAVAFTLFPMALIGAGVATAQGSRWAWAWWLATAFLLAVPALGGTRRRAGTNRVLERYASRPVRNEAALMRERAALLTELQEQQEEIRRRFASGERDTLPLPALPAAPAEAVTEPLPAIRDDLTERMFSVPCPDCPAQPPYACPMGIGIPVSLVRTHPVEFCHHGRIRAAVASGAVTEEEVSERYLRAAV